MLTDKRFLRAAFAGCVISLTVTFVYTGQRAISARPITESVVRAAASSRLLTFAAALAENEVPAGFVLALSTRPNIDPRDKVISSTVPNRVLPNAVAAFETAHPEYQVQEHNDVLLVEPREQAHCRAAVGRRVEGLRLRGTLHRALNDAFLKINPNHPTTPPGILGGPAPWPEIDVTFSGGSVADLLSAISKAVPGFVWVVREVASQTASDRACHFEYFYHQGRLATGWEVPHRRP